MMKNFLLIIFMLAGFSGTAFSQAVTGNIKGTVLTNDGEAAPMVSVQIKNRNRGAVTDVKGEFQIRRLQPGSYTLQVSLVGFETTEQTVQVTGNNTADVRITLQVSNTQLQEVTIKGTQRSGKRESDQIARLPIKNLENPQVYNTVGSELIKEQVVTNFDDALKNAPGVARLWSSTGRPGDGAGFFSMRGFVVQPTMINGIAGMTNGAIDPANIDHIETIKGPSGTLFGSSLVSFGGLINIVTKKPYETFGGELSYTGGGFGLSRVTADINTPLNEDKTAQLRVNAAYNYEGTYQDAGFKKSFFFAPSFSYQVNDRLSFNINTEFYNSEGTNTLMVFLNRSRPLIATNPKELGIDFTRSFTSNDLTNKNPTINLFGQVNYKLSSKWTSQTSITRSNRKSEGYYSYVMFLDQGLIKPNDTLLSRFAYNQNSISITTGIQQNFIGDFKIGNMRNRVVFGLDFLGMETTNNHSPFMRFDSVSAVNAADPRYSQINRAAVDARLATLTTGQTRGGTKNYTYSAYVSDVLNITDKFLAMASVRVDYFDNKGSVNFINGAKAGKYDQVAISPKFGLVYQIVKDQVSVFANYMNGFKNVPPPTNLLEGLPQRYDPQHANQYEGGVKLNTLGNRLNFTLSYYDITVDNMLRNASMVINGTNVNYSVQDATERHKGIEADLNASPVRGLNIIAGYAYNDSKLTKANPATEGLRPVAAGPEHMANFWASYTVTSGKLSGIGAGFGGNYMSDNVISNDRVIGKFTLPSYTVLNATVFYSVKAFRLALKMDNIANKEYYGGWTTVERQMPRRVSANATFRF